MSEFSECVSAVSAFSRQAAIVAGSKKESGDKASRRGSRFAPEPVVVGFSLIEILVVLVIVSVLALAVSISIASAGGERQLTREAERLQALLAHACRQAELGGREIGLRIGERGYSFSMLGFNGWTTSEREDELRPHTWVAGLRLELLRDGRPLNLADTRLESPQLVCFSSGELSPFLLRMELGDTGMRYELSGDVQGNVALRRLEIQP
ncbi:type II secretion system minor pseudopilin GspH [Dokdonella sp.]|uniref:type II secretion system minor pseudopilin GspH n=1 Tax=Dokdonella sp. TaxID=2291710 RepID=UPI003528BD58